MDNTSCWEPKNKKLLREVMVKIGLERKEGVTVETLLGTGAMGLVMSLEFVRKQGFK